jgi:hypothetical protein
MYQLRPHKYLEPTPLGAVHLSSRDDYVQTLIRERVHNDLVEFGTPSGRSLC